MSRTPDPEMRAHIRRAAQQAERLSGKGADRRGARAVLQWLDDTDADPPPNTVPVRMLVDVSPPFPPSDKRVVRAVKLDEHFGANQRSAPPSAGWQRSIHLCHAPVPLPVVELHVRPQWMTDAATELSTLIGVESDGPEDGWHFDLYLERLTLPAEDPGDFGWTISQHVRTITCTSGRASMTCYPGTTDDIKDEARRLMRGVEAFWE